MPEKTPQEVSPPRPHNVPPKYAHLLDDPNVARWHRNLAKGSPVTSKEYLRTLGIFVLTRGQTPAEFIATGQRACEDALHDWVNERIVAGKAGSSTDYYACVIQSWMKWNDIPLRRAVKVPRRNYNPRVKEFHIPNVEELRRVLALCDGRQKMTLGMIAFSGMRPGAIGNFTGTDGLCFADLPDAHFEGGALIFDKVPTRIRVREELSKAKHEYFTMLGPEGCDYIAAYVGQRQKHGEKVGPGSPLLPSQRDGRTFMQSESIGDLLRRPMRQAGVVLPPYIWRSYFNNRALLAEAEGFVRDYRVFFMGHRGDMEHVYALRKRIGEDMLEAMRVSYSRATRHLESRISERPEDPTKRITEAVLITAGMPVEQAAKIDYSGRSEGELMNLFQEAINRPKAAAVTPTREALPTKAAQKVVTLDEMRGHLQKGWRYSVKLADDAYVIDAPV